MYKLATDRRPRVVRPKKTFTQNQAESNEIHTAYKPVKINLSYHNCTGGDITIIDRENMKFTIKPLPSGARRIGEGIVVVKNYVFNDAVIIDEVNLSSELTPDREMLRKAFSNRRRTVCNETELDIVYSISPEAFREFDECVYIRELDIVITRNSNELISHPYSEQGSLLNGEPESIGEASTALGFRWVTHGYQAETLYFNLYGIVVSITSVHDMQMDEGFYVYNKGNRERGEATRLVRMSLEEAIEKYRLTRSLLEAEKTPSLEERIASDLDIVKGEQKLSVLEREHQLKLAQISNTEKTLMTKLEELERKAAADRVAYDLENDKRIRDHEQYVNKIRLEADKALRDMEMFKEKLRLDSESNSRKEYYEQRSLDRKDSSEIIKWLPGIIIGAGLLLPKLTS